MYLTEYLKMRGVNANALTNAESALLGIDIGEKGWVERNAHVAVPEALANAVRNGAKKVELRALATSLINGALPLETASPKNRKHYRSRVYIGPFELKMFEQFSMTNLEHAIKSSPLVLKSVPPWLRPFCRVRWN